MSNSLIGSPTTRDILISRLVSSSIASSGAYLLVHNLASICSTQTSALGKGAAHLNIKTCVPIPCRVGDARNLGDGDLHRGVLRIVILGECQLNLEAARHTAERSVLTRLSICHAGMVP